MTRNTCASMERPGSARRQRPASRSSNGRSQGIRSSHAAERVENRPTCHFGRPVARRTARRTRRPAKAPPASRAWSFWTRLQIGCSQTSRLPFQDESLTPSQRGSTCTPLDLRDLGEHLVPIDDHARNSSDPCFSLQIENARASVTSRFELVNSQCAIDGMYEPDFANARALTFRRGVSNAHIRRVDHHAEIPRESYVEIATLERTSTAPRGGAAHATSHTDSA
jgi:hypothetical protein